MRQIIETLTLVLLTGQCTVSEAPPDTGDTAAAIGCVEVPNYPDADADGWGCQMPGEMSAAVWACNPPPGYSAQLGDCDDADPSVNFGAADPSGDGLDTDCDGADG